MSALQFDFFANIQRPPFTPRSSAIVKDEFIQRMSAIIQVSAMDAQDRLKNLDHQRQLERIKADFATRGRDDPSCQVQFQQCDESLNNMAQMAQLTQEKIQMAMEDLQRYTQANYYRLTEDHRADVLRSKVRIDTQNLFHFIPPAPPYSNNIQPRTSSSESGGSCCFPRRRTHEDNL